jgi:hypothetical protein
VVVMLGVIAFAAWTMDRGDQTATSSGPARSPSSSRSTTGAGTSTTKAQAMEQFLNTYLATVTSDRQSAWDMLTPAYQGASGGFGSYNGFWGTIRSATPSNVTADPAESTVTYDVAYVKTNGDRTTEHHTLQLVPDGSSYLINDQLS